MQEELLQSIRRDIADFADPSTEVVVTGSEARWVQNRRSREVRFVARLDGLPDLHEGDQVRSYQEFFSSESMADLRALAESTLLTLNDVEAYRSPKARLERLAGDAATGDASAVVENLVGSREGRSRTQVVFVRGAAGAGKTALLRHLTVETARRFILGGTSNLYFYIDAQGRALSRLDEAIALILQDLRARFTYHAVGALTRMGLLIPVIDGFDELLGTGGYDEAFSSLARFLARLEGQGALVASARATFYQYSNFAQVTRRLGDASRDSLNFEISPVDVLPWAREEVVAYAADRAPGKDVAGKIQELFDADRDLLSTPFFVAQLVDLLSAGDDAPAPDRLISALVDRILEREVGKLRGPSGAPLLTVEQHRRLL